jgi:hypothetical protein
MVNEEVYIVVADLFEGAHSGGKYTAWIDEVPSDVEDTRSVRYFWDDPTQEFGVGATPDEALKDLLDKLE